MVCHKKQTRTDYCDASRWGGGMRPKKNDSLWWMSRAAGKRCICPPLIHCLAGILQSLSSPMLLANRRAALSWVSFRIFSMALCISRALFV